MLLTLLVLLIFSILVFSILFHSVLATRFNPREWELGTGINEGMLQLLPKKVIRFNDMQNTSIQNVTEKEISLDKSYATEGLFLEDQNYSNPTQQTVIPNGTILNPENAVKIGNNTFRCEDCFIAYDQFNNSIPVLTVNRDVLRPSFENNTLVAANNIFTDCNTIYRNPLTPSNETVPANYSNPTNATGVNEVECSKYTVNMKPIVVSNNEVLKDFVAEPTIAKHDSTLIFLNNYYGARSLDDGKTWNQFTDLNGDNDIEICCDQRVLYDGKHGIFVWYVQGATDKAINNNTNRLGVSKDGISWIMYYFTPQDIRPELKHTWFDFPYLVVGDKYLYLITTAVTPSHLHGIAIRFSLDDLSKCNPSETGDQLEGCGVNYDYYYSLKKPNLAPVNEVGDTLYMGFHVSNNQTRIYRWQGDLPWQNITYNTVGIPAWAPLSKSQTQCNPIDARIGENWCLRTDSRILTGWKLGQHVGFFWNANYNSTTETESKFEFPYINSATFNLTSNGEEYVGRPYIYNLGTVFLYPTTAVNSNGEVGMLTYYGEEVFKPSIVFGTTSNINENLPWDMEIIKKSSDIPKINPEENEEKDNPKAWGDFITLRSDGSAWYGTAFVLEGGGSRNYIQPYYIEITKK
jgi:hypothetical protein